MGIVTGYITLVLFIALFFSGIFYKKARKFHKPLCIAFIIVTLVHFGLIVKVLDTRSAFLNVSGICLFALSVISMIVWHFVKYKKWKLHLILSILMIVFVILHMVFYFIDYSNYKNQISEIDMEQIDVSDKKDGSYYGSYDAGYIYAEVRVDIKDGKIVKIELLDHDNERGEKAEGIVDRIVSSNSLDVEVISGATNSSKVIIKAIENALE